MRGPPLVMGSGAVIDTNTQNSAYSPAAWLLHTHCEKPRCTTRPALPPVQQAEPAVTNPDHLPPRSFWKFLERENATRSPAPSPVYAPRPRRGIDFYA